MKSQLSWVESPAMRDVAAVIDRVADCDATVLVTGESGVGKEVVARELHRRSARADRPFVKVNCAAVPADLLESEMFGHEKGAFTGAESATTGKFEAAGDGTLMLDEIADMPAILQAKLLHVLDDGHYSRVGGNRQLVADARVIAATNRAIPDRISEKLFREDLYYRLKVIEIHVPPLRERREEIETLARQFLEDYAAKNECGPITLSPALLAALQTYDWPGNIRELENVMQRYALLRNEERVIRELRNAEPADLRPLDDRRPSDDDGDLAAIDDLESLPDRVRRVTEAVEREVITRALDLVHWNRRRAAEQLGVSYKTLLNKTKALGLDAGSKASLVDSES
jgi:DNA-binding NtrC family response regulator